MSGIEKIANSINTLLNKVRVPVTPIPASILAFSVFKRPGLSSLTIAANIIRRQSEFGAPTGTLPDGSQNKMNALIYVMTDEIVKAIHKDSIIEGVAPAGTMVITGTGVSTTGPVTVTCTNTMPVKITGIVR